MDKPLAGKAGVLLDMYDAQSFGRDAAARFPQHAELFEEDLDLLHVHMGTIAGIVRGALASGDSATIREVGAFLDEALRHPRAISEIENAVAISFVDAREFRATETGRIAFAEMPRTVRNVLLEQDRRESERP